MDEELVDAINAAVQRGHGIAVEHEDGERVEGQVYRAEIVDGQLVLFIC